MAWIAGAILAGSYYQASEARKARTNAEEQAARALAQQQVDAAKMREELARQTAAYQSQATSLEAQASTAKQQFEAQQKQYAENKLAMEQKSKEVAAAADEERRKAAAAEASALRARTRGGRRSLLSEQRMDAELGVQSQLGVPMVV